MLLNRVRVTTAFIFFDVVETVELIFNNRGQKSMIKKSAFY